MASWTKKLNIDDRYSITLEVEETDTSIANNTSEVSYTLTATKSGGTGYYSNSAINTVKVTLDGNEIVNKKVSYDFTGSIPKTITLARGTETITHNDDGTKSLSCKGYFKDNANSLGSATASGTLTLSTIPRASVLDISGGHLTLGTSVNIGITRASTNFTHTLSYTFGSIKNEVIATNVEDSYTWTPPITLAQQIPDTTNKYMSITCKTYDGDSLIGTSVLIINAYVPNNLYPSVSISDPTIGGDMPIEWNVFVKGKTTAIYTLSGTGNQGSTINSYESTVDGYTYTTNNVTTNTLMTAGTNTITARVVDSRGKQASATKTFQVLDYSNPTISTAEVQRCDINGNVDKNGDYCLISYGASITPLNNNNTGYAAYLIKYKLHDEEEYEYAVPLSAFRNSYSASGMLYTDGIYPADRGSGTKLQLPSTNTYDIQFKVVDYFTEITNVQVLDTGFDLFNFNPSGKSMAVGKVSEASANEELLEVALDTEFIGEVNGGTINFTASNYHDSTKQDVLISGTNIKTINNTSILGSGNIDIQGGGTSTNVKINGTSITSDGVADIKTNGSYDATSNKIATMSDIPTIPFIPTKTSDLTNDSNFVTSTVSNLANYYTKTEVNNLISSIPQFSIEVVSSLPTQDISTTTIYLVPKTGSTNDVYNEYIYVNSSWELIGTTQVDLSNYYTKTQTDTLLNTKQNTLVSGTSIKTINSLSLLGSGDLVINDIKEITNNSININQMSTGYYHLPNNCRVYYRRKGENYYTVHNSALLYVNAENNEDEEYSFWLIDDYADYTNIAGDTIIHYGIVSTEFEFNDWNNTISLNDLVSDSSYVHTDNNYTTTEKNKLSSISSGAEVNDIDTIKVNGTAQTITNKAVDITVPTNVSELTNDSNYFEKKVGENQSNPVNLNTINAGAYVIEGYYIIGNNSPIARSSFYAEVDSWWNNKRIVRESGFEYVITRTGTSPNYTYTVTSDSYVLSNELSDVAYFGDYAYLTNKPENLSDFNNDANYAVFDDLAEVATSGDYTDLSNKPTNISDFTNDMGYVDSSIYDDLDLKQDALVSGTNIKTINNQSLLGSGNITIGGGGTATDVQVNGTSIVSNNIANLVTQSAYNSSTNKIATKNDIPTVNNGTLTIQKNGTNVQTFTANQSSNVTANIIVPTKTSELTNDSNYLVNSSTYVNTHPENNPVIIPFIHNDIAFLNQRGGSYVVKYDGVEQSQNINNVFDASPSYWAINPTGTTEIVIELTLHKSFTWSNSIYYDFGNVGWRAKNIKVEVMNSNYASDTWVTKQNLTNYGKGNGFVTTSHTPVGASNAGGGFNKIRFTFSGWANATIFRIAQLGVYNYGSLGVRETYMSRGRDDEIYRNISPAYDNTYDLGTSSKKWKDVYATTFNGNLTGTARYAIRDNVGNIITDTYYKASNPNGYTSNTGTITEITMNGASKGTSGVVDLGTVLTSHQTIKTINNTSMTGSGNVSVQPTLVSGTNIKTINNTSLLGSGNISISGGTATTVKINGTSITSNNEADIKTNGTYNASTNKIATMNDLLAYSLSSSDGEGSVTLGKLVVEWGTKSVTSSSSTSSTSPFSTYRGQTTLTFAHTFKNEPVVIVGFYASYANQISTNASGISTTGCTLNCYLTGGNSERTLKYIVIGEIS